MQKKPSSKRQLFVVALTSALLTGLATMGTACAQTIYQFGNGDGYNPTSGVSFYNGVMYGTTNFGGAQPVNPVTGQFNPGNVYSLTTAGEYTDLYQFPSYAAGSPVVYGGVSFDSKGNMWGTTSGVNPNTGLYDSNGTIFELTKTSGYTSLGTVISVPGISGASLAAGNNGSSPTSNLVFNSSNGLFYGTTAYGGANQWGNIFSVDPTTGKYTDLYDLVGPNTGPGIAETFGGLTVGPGGYLYGAALAGGTAGIVENGAIYQFNTADNSVNTLANFYGVGGGPWSPWSPPTLDASGNLWGTTTAGGTGDGGTIYEIANTGSLANPAYGAYQVAYNFGPNIFSGNTDPLSGLTEIGNDQFVGSTALGGPNGAGNLYEYNPSTGYTDLYDLNGINGANPDCAPQLYGGSLWDTASGGGIGPVAPGGGPGWPYGAGTAFEIPLQQSSNGTPEPGGWATIVAGGATILLLRRRRQTII